MGRAKPAQLRERWPHTDLTSLVEMAAELLEDGALRVMLPVEAVDSILFGKL